MKWNIFKKTVEAPVPQEVTSYEIVGDITLKKPQRFDNWRTGMWVKFSESVGILHDINGTNAEVHLVDESSGDTKLVVQTTLGALRQTTYTEIPEVRRSGFDRETARGMGYGD